ASFSLFGIPDREAQETHYELKIPWVMGLIATRSFSKEIPGITELAALSEMHIRDGLLAYDALETLKVDEANPEARETFLQNQEYLGYALLLKKYVEDPRDASDQQIVMAVQ